MKSLRRAIALLVLAGFLAGQAAVWVAAHHAALEDDVACVGTEGTAFVGEHHQRGPQVEAPSLPAPTDHCLFCHLHRSAGSVRVARGVVVAPPPGHTASSIDETVAPAVVVISEFVPRGPPSFLS